MKKYIPNFLTTYRVLIAFTLVPLYITDNYRTLIYFFISAVLTDLLDGYLARKWKVVSTYGKIADMIGDKLLAVFATTIFILKSNKIFILTLILEAVISIINVTKCIISGSIKTKDFTGHDSSMYGKIKTWFLFISLSVALLSIRFEIFESLVTPLVILTAIIQLITAIDYTGLIKRKHIA